MPADDEIPGARARLREGERHPATRWVGIEAGLRLGSYEILDRIGAGGMGEVYRARDLSLGRDVAVKVLPEELTRDPERLRRFEREARAASALNHPNIVVIHAIGDEDGTPYIVMEYVEGRTVRQLLADGALPVEELFRLASQMAAGLAKAHAAGIVHRDLKPENVMVSTDGFVKILDFGLAKLMPTAAEGAGETTLTVGGTIPGRILGTVGYMAPEQARGATADFRSDHFALGAILYEMATGRRAFDGGTAIDTLAAILGKEPQPLLGADFPPSFRSLVERCLAKDPEDRFPSTEELARSLSELQQRTVSGDSLVGSGVPSLDRGPERRAQSVRSLAILPLVSLGADPGEEYFADGMTEALIADLAQLGGLRVISRTSVMRFKGTEQPLPEIAQSLDVEAIVEGSILRAGNRVRITAQLVHAPTDSHLWAQSYERELGDVLALQSEVASAIASEIGLCLAPREQARLEEPRAVHPGAHEAYLLGRYHLNQRTTAALEKAVAQFEAAIERAPGYALAHSGLADALALLVGAGHGVSAAGVIGRAKAAATRALELDPSLSEAHTSLAFLRFKFDWNWSGAEIEFRRAVGLSPSNANAHHWYALYLSAMARHEEAKAHIRKARTLDPLSLIIRVAAARVLQFARDFDAAIQHSLEALKLDPDYAEAHFTLGMGYLYKGTYPPAVEALERAVALSGRRPLYLGVLGNAYARSRRADQARRILDELQELAEAGVVSATGRVLVHTGLGERESALACIDQAIDRREGSIVFLNVDPLVDDLRSDPRSLENIRRLGLLG